MGINDIENEMIIGLAGGLGIDFNEVQSQIASKLALAGYHVEIIKIAENFEDTPHSSLFAKCYWKMQYSTKQRQIHGNDYWAKKVIAKIFNMRKTLGSKHRKIAYLVRSLKNKAEFDLLSDVYGRNFITISIFSDNEASLNFLKKKLEVHKLNIVYAQEQIHFVNTKLGLGKEIDIQEANQLYLDDFAGQRKVTDQEKLIRFLMRKDQEETHPDLKEYGQNLFKCYSNANYFIYQNKYLEQQIKRFSELMFNYPFAEPTYDEYFMFFAQATSYRSLDLDRQVGAVIVDENNELVASGFNDVSKVGGGSFANHHHPMGCGDNKIIEQRDFAQSYDYNHKYLDQIANKIAKKLNLNLNDQSLLREEIRGITEFKRSTHAEMAALVDAARRGVAVQNCIMYINTYPCHNCTKHIIASGIKKVVFLHPYTKSKASEMYPNMIKHGVYIDKNDQNGFVIFEPFLGVSPNKFTHAFENDKESRLEKQNDLETGKVAKWEINELSMPQALRHRKPHAYIYRELEIINNKLPDITLFYN